jgi:Flp pilus assembly protein TadG
MTAIPTQKLNYIANATADSVLVKGGTKGDMVIDSNGALLRKKITALTGATTITTAQSGTCFTLGTAAGFTVTLPAVANCSGCEWDFVVKVAPTGSYIIHSAANNIHGSYVCSDLSSGTDSGSTLGTAVDDITFVLNKAQIGDKCNIWSDGTYFYATVLGGGVYDAVTLA